MDIQDRIRQFETMVAPGADPDNDMAWFSLGQAYAQAGRHADAARAFDRCIALNKDMSKAYQLAGQAYMQTGELSRATEVLTAGYVAAASRGDRMPQQAMGEMLTKLGQPVPTLAGRGVDATPAAGSGTFVCARTGRAGRKMSRPPFRGPVGEWIFANISQETFDAWVRQGTKVINEMRLDLSRDEDAETYDRHMREYLGIDDELYARLTGER